VVRDCRSQDNWGREKAKNKNKNIGGSANERRLGAWFRQGDFQLLATQTASFMSQTMLGRVTPSPEFERSKSLRCCSTMIQDSGLRTQSVQKAKAKRIQERSCHWCKRVRGSPLLLNKCKPAGFMKTKSCWASDSWISTPLSSFNQRDSRIRSPFAIRSKLAIVCLVFRILCRSLS